MSRRILVVTSGRADATPLAPVVRELRGRGHDVEVGGLTDDAGEPRDRIAMIEACLHRSIWLQRPDLLLVLGDRYETLSACLAATIRNIPIAHIHGGEITRGSFDNQIRDAITKLSHIHFVATQAAATRLMTDLDEYDDRVHLVGAPGLDNLVDLPPRVPTRTLVLTYHPETLGALGGTAAAVPIVQALRQFPDYDVIWTGVNNDPGADLINSIFSHHWKARKLTAREYHLACRQAAAVIGNSSSGIIEAPTLEVPTVNIGTRQDGREEAASIFTCAALAPQIEEAICRAIEYRGDFANPYGLPGASKKIADILTSIELDGILVK